MRNKDESIFILAERRTEGQNNVGKVDFRKLSRTTAEYWAITDESSRR
jgi:hypothetical protein